MPAETEIVTLIVKYLNEELSPEEREELANWLRESPDHPKLLENLLTQEGISEDLRISADMDKEGIWKELKKLTK